MKLNNKGFAISTILYGLLALVVLILMLIFAVMRTSNNNSKDLGESISKELLACRSERIEYNSSSDPTDLNNLNLCLKSIKKTLSPDKSCLDIKIACNNSDNCSVDSDWQNCL